MENQNIKLTKLASCAGCGAKVGAGVLACKMMTTLNKSALDTMVKYNVHACTDVTGFGLLGHTYEMAEGSDVEITLNVDAIDRIPEALELARMGILPVGMYRNRKFAEPGVDAGDIELAKQDMLYDPQTAGVCCWPQHPKMRTLCSKN